MHLLQKAWAKLPTDEQNSIRNQVIKSLANSTTPEPLPLRLQHDPLKIILKGSGVVAVSSILKSWLLKKNCSTICAPFYHLSGSKNWFNKRGVLPLLLVFNLS